MYAYLAVEVIWRGYLGAVRIAGPVSVLAFAVDYGMRRPVRRRAPGRRRRPR